MNPSATSPATASVTTCRRKIDASAAELPAPASPCTFSSALLFIALSSTALAWLFAALLSSLRSLPLRSGPSKLTALFRYALFHRSAALCSSTSLSFRFALFFYCSLPLVLFRFALFRPLRRFALHFALLLRSRSGSLLRSALHFALFRAAPSRSNPIAKKPQPTSPAADTSPIILHPTRDYARPQ